MTQEEKQLLLKDLCSRLPYGVRVKIYDESILLYEHNENGTLDGKETMSDDCFVIKGKNDSWIISCEDFKPYLRLMSSMTNEEREEWADLFNLELDKLNEIDDENKAEELAPYCFGKSHQVSIDWLNAHHFDYHNLIPMGLALEAPENMYKNE